MEGRLGLMTLEAPAGGGLGIKEPRDPLARPFVAPRVLSCEGLMLPRVARRIVLESAKLMSRPTLRVPDITGLETENLQTSVESQ